MRRTVQLGVQRWSLMGEKAAAARIREVVLLYVAQGGTANMTDSSRRRGGNQDGGVG